MPRNCCTILCKQKSSSGYTMLNIVQGASIRVFSHLLSHKDCWVCRHLLVDPVLYLLSEPATHIQYSSTMIFSLKQKSKTDMNLANFRDEDWQNWETDSYGSHPSAIPVNTLFWTKWILQASRVSCSLQPLVSEAILFYVMFTKTLWCWQNLRVHLLLYFKVL